VPARVWKDAPRCHRPMASVVLAARDRVFDDPAPRCGKILGHEGLCLTEEAFEYRRRRQRLAAQRRARERLLAARPATLQS
jgi:hypothetical protein